MRSLFEAPAISVGELCRRIRGTLRERFHGPVRVVGEVSKCTVVDGHVYFKLKDREGLIDCICFRDRVQSLRLQLPLADGVAVEVDGFVEIWPPKSTYQLRVQEVVPVGLGALHVAFQRLKARLEEEGLFAESRKRPIPSFVRSVAIVTSRDAAVLHDFLSTCRRRGAHVKIHVVPTKVQGAAAAPSVARAIRAAGRLPVDAVVVARGGGSLEDLWAFNTEQVARAIAACEKPVISAIGHAPDVTIADFVADKHVATATAAAEFVAAERDALLARVRACENRLRRSLSRLTAAPRPALRQATVALQRAGHAIVFERTQRLDELTTALRSYDPRRQMERWKERADAAALQLPALARRAFERRSSLLALQSQRLQSGFVRLIEVRVNQLEVAQARLDALGPHHTLKRGYAIVYDHAGKVLTGSAQTRVGERIGIELRYGRLGATVDEVQPDD